MREEEYDGDEMSIQSRVPREREADQPRGGGWYLR